MAVAYVLNNYYNYDTRLGGIFEKDNIGSLASIEDGAGTVFCGDGGATSTTQWDPEQFVNDGNTQVLPNATPPVISSNYQGGFIGRHNSGANVTFFDGHTKWFKISELGKMKKDAVTGNDVFPYFTKIPD